MMGIQAVYRYDFFKYGKSDDKRTWPAFRALRKAYENEVHLTLGPDYVEVGFDTDFDDTKDTTLRGDALEKFARKMFEGNMIGKNPLVAKKVMRI